MVPTIRPMDGVDSLHMVRTAVFGDPMVATGEDVDFMAVRILEAVVVDFHLPHHPLHRQTFIRE